MFIIFIYNLYCIQMKNCPLCGLLFINWNSHHIKCSKIQLLDKQSRSYLQIQQKRVCKHCWNNIDINDLQKHSKSCLRNMRKKAKSVKSAPMPDLQSRISQDVSQHAVLPKSQYIESSLHNLGSTILKNIIPDFAQKTSYLNLSVMSNIFALKLHEPFLNLQIPQINIQSLKNKYGPAIIDIVGQVNDVFNVEKVQKCIISSRLSYKKKHQLVRQFNQYLKFCKFNKMYKITPAIKYSSKDKGIVLYRELIQFVLLLFKTKKKKKIHLGLDLMIIFQSAQRFPSSMEIVQSKIQEIVKSSDSFAIIPKTTKTYTKGHLIISNDLKKLLHKFKWKNFLLTADKLGRIKHYLGISLIQLRRGFFIQMINGLQKHIDFSKYTMHTTNQVASIYLQSLILAHKRKFHEKLIIPTNEYQLQKICCLDLTNKKKPKILDEGIFRNDLDLDFMDINFEINQGNPIQPSIQMYLDESGDQIQDQKLNNNYSEVIIQNQNIQQNIIQNQNIQQNIKINFNSTGKNACKQQINIDGITFQLNNGLFNDQIFFKCKSFQLCRKCNKGPTTMMCIFCLKKYHQICLPNFCQCMKLNTKSVGIKASSDKKSNLKILMPQQYFNKNLKYLDSFRKLIHMRGFYMTTCATLLMNQQILSQNIEKATEIKLQDYYLYENGSYFPPLALAISGDQNSSGTGIGVFAYQNIDKNVFLGEYAGDIVSENQMIFVKRRDMSMELTKVNNITYYVASVKHCSYIQLVNSSKVNVNCQIILVIINNTLKLLLYTSKFIQKGKQLLYDYGQNFNIKYRKGLKGDIQVIRKQQIIKINVEDRDILLPQKIQNSGIETHQQKFQIQHFKQIEENNISSLLLYQSQVKKFQKTKQIINEPNQILKNVCVQQSTNTCYAECLFIIYKYFHKYFLSNSSPLSKQLKRNKLNPLKYIKQFEGPTRNNEQHDLMQFYYFIQNKLQGDSPFKQFTVLQTRQCHSCQFQSQIYLCQKQWYLIKQNVQMMIFSEVEMKCQNCKINTQHSSKKQLKSSPELILMIFKRNQSQSIKLKYPVIPISQFIHLGETYVQKLNIVHKGDQADQGHYIVYFPKQQLAFNNNKLIQDYSDYSKDNYMIIYEKVISEEPISKMIQTKLNISPSWGLYIKLGDTQIVKNKKKCFLIASIVKIISYLTCKMLCNLFKLNDKVKFTVPNIQIYGSSIVLKTQQRLSIKDLFDLMLISSSCDAAFTLSFNFGNMLRQSNIDSQQYDPQTIFVNEMQNFCRTKLKMLNTIIKDSSGLKGNFSTIDDLLLLLEYIKNQKQLIIILSQPFINYKQLQLKNTNQLVKNCIGKTGTYNQGSCFIGLHENQPIICTNFENKKRMFNLIEDYIRLKRSNQIGMS